MTPIPGDVFNLAVGQPSRDLIPVHELHETMTESLQFVDDPLLFQYPSVEGALSMRRDLSHFLFTSGRYPSNLSPGNLRITYGNSHAIPLAIQALTQPGDNVIVENPTYFLSSKFFSECHVTVHGCTAHAGLDMDEFVSIARKVKPKLVYVNPIHHNPSGTCLSTLARERLLHLSVELGFYILSDEPYVLLSFNQTVNESETSLATTAQRVLPNSYDRLICFGSFSKIIAPGLRCGWINSSNQLLNLISQSGSLVSGGSPAPILVESIRRFITSGRLITHLDFLCEQLQARRDALILSLTTHLGDEVSFHHPTGGYFVYVTFERLGSTINLQEYIAKHSHNSLKFLPAQLCCASAKRDGPYISNAIRLSFSFYNPKELDEAIRELAKFYYSFIAA